MRRGLAPLTPPEPCGQDCFTKGKLAVVTSSEAAVVSFHLFLEVDVNPIGWACTAVASVMAFVQARRRRAFSQRAWRRRGQTSRSASAAHAAACFQIFLHLKFYSAPTLQARGRRGACCLRAETSSLLPRAAALHHSAAYHGSNLLVHVRACAAVRPPKRGVLRDGARVRGASRACLRADAPRRCSCYESWIIYNFLSAPRLKLGVCTTRF